MALLSMGHSRVELPLLLFIPGCGSTIADPFDVGLSEDTKSNKKYEKLVGTRALGASRLRNIGIHAPRQGPKAQKEKTERGTYVRIHYII